MSYTKNKETNEITILDRNDYYPFGLNFVAAQKPKFAPKTGWENYKYQEQELQETGFYAFKWRQYMPDVGRFFTVDPIVEKYAYNSTYAFQENKLGLGRELEGL